MGRGDHQDVIVDLGQEVMVALTVAVAMGLDKWDEFWEAFLASCEQVRAFVEALVPETA